MSRLGALPLALPHEVEKAEQYLDLLDGLGLGQALLELHDALAGAREHVRLHVELIARDQVQFAQRRLQYRSEIALDVAPHGASGLRQALDQALHDVIDTGIFHFHVPRVRRVDSRPAAGA